MYKYDNASSNFGFDILQNRSVVKKTQTNRCTNKLLSESSWVRLKLFRCVGHEHKEKSTEIYTHKYYEAILRFAQLHTYAPMIFRNEQ